MFQEEIQRETRKGTPEILYQAKRLDEQLKKAFGDIPQFSKQLSDEITPFVKSYVAEAIDKYVAEEHDKIRAFQTSANVQYPDAVLSRVLFNILLHFRKSMKRYRQRSMKALLKKKVRK